MDEESHIKYATLLADTKKTKDWKEIMSQQLSINDKVSLGHELMHLITNDGAYNQNKVIREALAEGLSMAVELELINILSDEKDKIDINSVVQHCQRTVTDNKELFEETDSMNLGHGSKAGSRRFYDGFRFERNLIYIAGLNFVEQVLGGKLEKWRFITGYGLTIPELLNPQKHIEKWGKELSEYPTYEVEPKHPTIIT